MNSLRSQALAPQGKGEQEQTDRHTVKAHVEGDQSGSSLTNAKKKGMERSEERGNGGRAIGGRGTKRKGGGVGVGWEGRRRRRGEQMGEDRGVK